MKRKLFNSLPVIILALGLAFAGCDNGTTGNGGGGENDPISVDLSLPPIKEVAAFSGTFVSSETDAKSLVTDAFTEISGISPSPSVNNARSLSRSIARSVHTEPYEEIYDHDTTILTDAEVTGFIQGKATQSVADDDRAGETVGDYMEVSLKGKLAIVFTGATKNGSTINGKYGIDENMYYKLQVTSINPVKEALTISSNTSDGYAVSISKGGKGLKFVMRIENKINNKTIRDVASFDLDDLGTLFDTYRLTLDIYDNANVKQEQYSKTFTSYKDAAAYLGINN
ncbi:MAG: hypothetical protein LBD93_00610 [Treponema sp.]|jgi:hypothetical protein|nr:hypothetical protein [Treponema sp.]